MKTKRTTAIAVLLGFIISLGFLQTSATAQKKTDEKTFIPKQVTSILKDGLAARLPRQDVRFAITGNTYLPAKENVHAIFFFTIKNQDLSFASHLVEPKEEVVIARDKSGEKKEEQKAEIQGQMFTNFDVFLQFYRVKDKNLVEVVREGYIPVKLTADAATYDPEKVEVYSTGHPLPPGDYLLAMAVTSADLAKIGTAYYEFSLPNMNDTSQTLNTTPIFFVKDIQQMSVPETRPEVHKDNFVWYYLQIEPKRELVFSPAEYLDIFFYIFGARPSQQGKNDIIIDFEVLQNGEKVIVFAPLACDSAIISQPLRLRQTVIVKQEGVEVRREEKDLQPGTYTLVLNIKDNVSGKTVSKSVDFEIK